MLLFNILIFEQSNQFPADPILYCKYDTSTLPQPGLAYIGGEIKYCKQDTSALLPPS